MSGIGAILLAAVLALRPEVAFGRGQSGHSRSHSHATPTTHPGHHHGIKRDPAQRRHFMQQHPCPGGQDAGSMSRCHGYVVDHIKPLKRGGRDRPSNMQWQTTAEAKAKDRWE